jgi:ADP-ribosylglycohydrolase/protein-tyrosine phosphatase
MADTEAQRRRDRARGALLGLACGDAVGTTLEFKPPGTFEPITDMVGGGPFHLQAGQFTDDTSMALCLAESLLDRDGHDPADQLRRYVQWYRHGYFSPTGKCFDIGGTTRTQLQRFERTGEPSDPNVNDDAAANGSLMRLAAVPIRWHTSIVDAAEWSAESSRTTHAATRPVDACRLLGAMIAALIQGASADDVFAPSFWSFGEPHPEVEAIARGSWRDKEPPEIRGTGYCIDALEAAIWAVVGADDYRSAVLRAANLGDDADTTAAIAGQLAGARFGVSNLPREWLAKLSMKSRIQSLADGLFDATTGDAPSWEFDDEFHAWWVEPGQLLAGEYPGDKKAERARHKIDLLVDAGIRTFIDLTEADELEPYAPIVNVVAEARALDLRHVRHPIRDVGVIDNAGYRAIVDTINSEIANDRPVFVHCWGGVGRTGTVVGCWLVDHGAEPSSVLGRLAELRAGTQKAHRRSPETPQQAEAIRRYR